MHMIYLMTRFLGHGVEGRTVLEPLELLSIEGVLEDAVPGLAVRRVNLHRHRLAHGNVGDMEVDLVVRRDLVVISGILKGQRQHALLLQVGLVNTSE